MNFPKASHRPSFPLMGFTLVELLVVVTILAILSIVAYSAFGSQTIQARDARRKQDLAAIEKALELYFLDYGRYPMALANGSAEAGNLPARYLSPIPTDPGRLKRNYLYSYTADRSAFELAATLENGGDVIEYEAYVVGNSDVPLTQAVGGFARRLDAEGVSLVACPDGTPILPGPVTDDLTGCIPFDPNRE